MRARHAPVNVCTNPELGVVCLLQEKVLGECHYIHGTTVAIAMKVGHLRGESYLAILNLTCSPMLILGDLPSCLVGSPLKHGVFPLAAGQERVNLRLALGRRTSGAPVIKNCLSYQGELVWLGALW